MSIARKQYIQKKFFDLSFYCGRRIKKCDTLLKMEESETCQAIFLHLLQPITDRESAKSWALTMATKTKQCDKFHDLSFIREMWRYRGRFEAVALDQTSVSTTAHFAAWEHDYIAKGLNWSNWLKYKINKWHWNRYI